MPEQTYPPYAAGAKTVPRQLNRWLDINPQGGPLQRTSSYVVIPAFNVITTQQIYSDLIATFNYTATNNFSFRKFVAPASSNYTVCVSWADNNASHRYVLWYGNNPVLYFNPPLYNGQVIKKNFRIEIWSDASFVTSYGVTFNNPSPVTIYTSVLGNYDYRYQDDTTLATAENINTSFSDPGYFINVTKKVGTVFAFKNFVIGSSYYLNVATVGLKTYPVPASPVVAVQGDTLVATQDTYYVYSIEPTLKSFTFIETPKAATYALPLTFNIGSSIPTN